MSSYPRFANYIRKTGKPPFQWTESGSFLLRSEGERQYLLKQGYTFPNWKDDGERSAEILAFPQKANPLDGTRLWENS